MKRALLGVLFADVAGYSRMMEAAEHETFERMRSLREDVMRPAIRRCRGRVVKWTGDGFLAVFPRTADPVRCAIDIQEAVIARENDRPRDRALLVRMGISFGEVLVDTEDVYGTEVNVAARLQEIAEPGHILISHSACDNLAGPKPALIDLGPQALRNLASPVSACRVLLTSEAHRGAWTATRATKRPSIAVLPFHSLDGSPNLGEGIAEQITTALTSLREVMVISRQSTQALATAAHPARDVGEKVGARYVLSGSVRRFHKRLRITAELADAAYDTVLWANHYDLAADDLFDVQDQITSVIVHTLAPEIQQAELRRIEQKRPESMTAYDYYIQGLTLMYRLRLDEFIQAGSLLRRAIALDNSYAAAFAAAAEWHSVRLGQGWSPDHDADCSEAIRLAEAAIDRDRQNALALAVLGHLNAFMYRRYDRALALFDQALATSPGHARAWALSAPTFNYIGEPEAAIRRAHQALLLSPLDPLAFWSRTSVSIAHYTLGDYTAAIAAGEAALTGNDRYTTIWKTLAASFAATGAKLEAASAAAKVMELQPGFRAETYAETYPYRDPALRHRLREHLVAAGLPD